MDDFLKVGLEEISNHALQFGLGADWMQTQRRISTDLTIILNFVLNEVLIKVHAAGVTPTAIVSEDFKPFFEVARIMSGFPGPWFVFGGWAIDLFLGEVTRAHSDVEMDLSLRPAGSAASTSTGWALGKSG